MNILFTISHAGARGGIEAAAFTLLHQFKEYGINAKLFSIVPYEGADEGVVSLPNKEYERYRRINRSVVNKVLGNALAKRFLRRKIQAMFNCSRPFCTQHERHGAISLGDDLYVQKEGA